MQDSVLVFHCVILKNGRAATSSSELLDAVPGKGPNSSVHTAVLVDESWPAIRHSCAYGIADVTCNSMALICQGGMGAKGR